MARDRELVARFEREAQAAGKIGSKHVCGVYDLGGLADGDRYMIMEFLEGETLHQRLKRERKLGVSDLVPIGIQLLEGLAKVHDADIVHRDLKPANIFLARDDGRETVKILDFGICKMKSGKGVDLSTGIGDLLGTLPYMCPEQLEHGNKKLDGRADLYAVGVMLYRCVTGELPYRAPNLQDLLALLRSGHAPKVTDLEPDVDRGFASIVDRAIEWDPKARYANARDFRDALVGWTKDRARVERLLADFVEIDRTPAAPPAPSRPRPAFHEEAKTQRYAGADRDAQLLDNLHAEEDDTPAASDPSPERPRANPRQAVETSTKKRKRKSTAPPVAGRESKPTVPKNAPLPRFAIEGDDDDEAQTLPRHGTKR
jgi:serine/threonine-protein kinase